MTTHESQGGAAADAASGAQLSPTGRLAARWLGALPKSYVAISLVYFVFYVALNKLTAFHEFDATSITLWSPDNGISLLLLMESIAYTPVVLLASIVVDLQLHAPGYSLLAILTSDLILTLGYIFIAVVLRDAFQFNFRAATFGNVIALLAVVPASAVATSILYCCALFAAGALSGQEIFDAIRFFWVGDAVGMIVVIPAFMAFYDTFVHRRWRAMQSAKNLLTAAVIAGCVLVLDAASVGDVNNRYLFNLLFMPTIWVGIGYGFSATAVMLLFTQLSLIGALTYFGSSDQNFAVLQTLMFILAATGQLLGAVISEREQTTRLLRKQQSELSRVATESASGALAITLAHEISQPLSSVASYVHGARRMLEGGRNVEAVIHALTKAEGETRRARDVIARIRDFVASGQLELETVDLRELARKIVALNAEEAAAHHILLRLDAQEPPPSLRLDRLTMEQALNNLVVNALDAAASGAGGLVTLSVFSNDECAYIQVDDDGPGVSPDIAERLFEAFETTKAKGMGLGLPLAQQIVRKHSGQLTWRARKPTGASFTISLPLQGPHDAKL